MNKQTIKCIATSLAVLGCMYTIPQRVFAETISSNDAEVSTSYAFHKDKCKEKDKEKDDCKCKDEKKKKDESKCKDEEDKKDDSKCKEDCKKKDESDCKNELKDKEKAKDDSKCKHGDKLDMFTDDNCKYLSSDQKKCLKEYKEIVEKGDKLSDEQRDNLRTMIDTILKGKLGDEKYKDFMSIMEKKSQGTKLTSDEENKLKEYKDIIEK